MVPRTGRDLSRMEELYTQHNWTLQRIGGEFGITREMVRQHLNRRGVDTSGRHRHIEKRCTICNTVYRHHPNEKTYRARGICSRPCYEKHCFVMKPCDNCGRVLKKYRRAIARSKTGRVFCDHVCKGEWLQNQFGGTFHGKETS
jgi:hypothetical protein